MNKLTLLVPIVLLSGVIALGAASQPKFRPSSVGGAGVGRYAVTLTEEAGFDDAAALLQELAQLYGAKLDEATTSSGGRQFVVTMTYARARLLSSDPRVIEVAEVPPTMAEPTPAASPSSTASHLTPRPSSYGDNGQSGAYTYDGAGNITAIGADTYVYDSAQRLVSSVTRGVQENYTYDAYGNRTSATGAVNCLGQTNCTQTVTIDSNTNHLTTINGAAVTYDVAGNIKTIAATTGSPGAVYSYDALGMMIEATVGSDDRQFIYNADNERIAVKQGASWTWMIRDQSGKVLREFTSLESGSAPNLVMSDWQWAKDYVWRDGLLLATVSPSGTLHYHLDHLGTPRLVTDSNGVKVAEHAYYPFGAEINLTPHETPEEPMKFTGHERDIVAGEGRTLDYMHARYYSSNMGRFLSVDPVDGLQRFPQSWNRYAYARNNPLKYIDPTGMYEFAACTGNEQQCQADKTAFEQSRQADLQSHDQTVHDAAAAYGDPGQVNGVSVAFGSPTNAAGTTTAALQGNANGTMGMMASVMIQTGLRGTELNAAVGHEGQHVLDAQGFVGSFTMNAASWNLSKNLTAFMTETNGYRITDSIYRSANQSFSTGCRGCTLGAGARTPADRDLAITRILADPTGPYRVTPQNQGNRQFPEWTTPPPQP